MIILALSMAACSQRNDEKHVRAFIDAHLKLIEPKFKAFNLASWNANATGEKKYYDEQAALEYDIRTVYSNKKDFEQIKAWKDDGRITDPLLQRQLIILHNSYLTNQLDTVLMKKMADMNAEISNAFNTFRPTIDGRQVTDNEIEKILKTEINQTKRRKAWEASKEVAVAIAPKLIELVKLRNQAARQLGFSNFFEMSLITGEQTVPEIVAIFDELKTLTDSSFGALKSDIDAKLAARYGITKDQLRPWHYQDRFFQEAPALGTVDLDKYYKGKKIEDLARTYYAKLNLPVDEMLKKSDLYGRKGKYQHAFCQDMDRLGDVRTMQSLEDNHRWMGTMLHELGHAVYSLNVDRSLPYLLRIESHTFTTEAIAMLNERQASNADWLQVMTGIPESEKQAIRQAGQENLRMHALIFCRWTQVMMRFEKAMYENPDQDLNKLWWSLVKEYQMITPPEGRNAPDWASKIHLALYPAYYHNYELGELAASQFQHYIASNILKQESAKDVCFAGKPEIGEYLRTKVFMPGARLRWDALMKEATGEPLTAKYFAEEYVK
ncbi:MAG TPA: M2 family metallopeptidase [Bacteroidota bacterium]|nr:M2 family metallopeptidase [Bacteroidota bacterium]